MKVQDLFNEIVRCRERYGSDFMDWDVFTEQITEADKERKSKYENSKWRKVHDPEDWEYYRCAGFWTKIPEEKIFTINVNY